MKKFLIFLFSSFFSVFAISQSSQADSLGKENTFFLEIKKISCPNNQSFQEIYLPENSYLNSYQGNLLSTIPFISKVIGTRLKNNDSTKFKECLSIKLSKNIPIYECNVCELALRKVLNCEILDTIINSEVWVLKTGKVHQLKPFSTDTTLYRAEFRQGVYVPDMEDDPVENIIVKNGILRQFIYDIEWLSNNVIVLEDETRRNEKFSFEIPLEIIKRRNFEEIRATLKENIDFDLYKVIKPIKVKYVRFLE
jgi:hypothetical protein